MPDTVRYSFDIGAVVLLGAILWTVVTTARISPDELHGFADATPLSEGVEPGSAYRCGGCADSPGPWLAVSASAGVALYALDRMLYVLGGMARGWGVLLLVNSALRGSSGPAAR